MDMFKKVALRKIKKKSQIVLFENEASYEHFFARKCFKNVFINMRQFLAFELLLHFDHLFSYNLQNGDKYPPIIK